MLTPVDISASMLARMVNECVDTVQCTVVVSMPDYRRFHSLFDHLELDI